ncbi:MAG: hypothetical protein JXR87_10305, partial [Candidatus Marinimicrobia bacterium]|nr:hypothetical protein [Candidatus Neomarinimicrobiota bacterium]
MNRTGLFILVVLMAFGLLMAQTPALVNWSCTEPDYQEVSAEGGNLAGLAQISSPGFEVRDYLNGPGPDQRWWPYADGAAVSWGDETGQVDSRWVQFAAYPKAGFEFQCTEISIYLGAKGTGNLRANVAIDTSADFSTALQLNGNVIELLKDDDSLYTFTMAMNISAGDTIYFRVYPWYTGTASTSKYLYVRNMTISGTTQAIPVAAYALWPFEEDNRAVTNGPLVAYTEAYSDAMKFYEITTLPTTGGYDVTCGSIQTVSKSWNAEPNPTDSLWFEYAVEPKFGGTFTVKEISLYIGGWFTSNMRAAFYYSKDSTFSSKTLLIADTLLYGDQVMPLCVNLVDTVKTGETFYLRVSPHNTEAVGWAKLVAMDSVKISGVTFGATADPPTVSTSAVSKISTNNAVCGGTVTNDGGAIVTERGVCWNTSGSPTIADNRTSDGQGAGSFTSNVSSLSKGTTYFIRAYAINAAGTAYGEELSFTSLASIIVPTVSTNSISNIMVKTAICGGYVSDWGGGEVTVRGICWSTTDSPTISDNFTEDGEGTGSFTSGLYDLVADTKYYVRAYAANSAGTGYGNEQSFTTQIPAGPVLKVVAKDGTGNYETVQAAFDDIPNYYTGQYTIFVKKGKYYEKLMLDRYKTNVVLKGEDRDSTILTYDDYAGIAGGTSMCYSVAIDADDFIAENITFQNTVKNDGLVSDQQAVALRVNGDRQAYYNCNLLGYQDTYYTWGGRGTGRVYMKNCYI